MPPSGLLGILGGLGPLASAAFVRNLYRLAPPEHEQDAPRCILLSDPSFPDRTAALEQGEEEVLAERLTIALETLTRAGAERIVIACFTVHAVLDRVPEELRARVISLLDRTVDELARLVEDAPADGVLLLLATRGSRRAGLFTGHPRWPEVAHRVVLLSDADQDALHERLYQLKAGQPPAGMVPWLKDVQARYGAAGFIFGCTEAHLLHEVMRGDEGWTLVDPLLSIARGASAGNGPPME